jgi:uncharacterized protein with NRDE domain
MCTLIVLHRCVPDRPLVVAANRDEFLDRPAEGPALRWRPSGPFLAPLDLEAGGTWLGLNAQGVFVGLTNLRPAGAVEAVGEVSPGVNESSDLPAAAVLASGPIGRPGARSRGEVVMAALDARTASEAAAVIEQLEEEAYNPFQLLVADAREAWLSVYRDRPRTRLLEPGIHVVGNVEDDGLDTLSGVAPSEASNPRGIGRSAGSRAKKLTRIQERVEKLLAGSGRDLLEGLAGVCREHVEADPFESTCVHVANRYGTRSSLLLELADRAGASRLWATDGPPCERDFEDLTALLGRLDLESRRLDRG